MKITGAPLLFGAAARPSLGTNPSRLSNRLAMAKISHPSNAWRPRPECARLMPVFLRVRGLIDFKLYAPQIFHIAAAGLASPSGLVMLDRIMN